MFTREQTIEEQPIQLRKLKSLHGKWKMEELLDLVIQQELNSWLDQKCLESNK